MAKVLRIETKERGLGLYNSGAIHRAAGGNLSYLPNAAIHPEPYDDKRLEWWKISPEERYNYYFGFTTVEQVLRWLKPQWLTNLSTDTLYGGIVLSEYEVPDEFFRAGDNQAVFKKDNATLLSQRRPDDLLNEPISLQTSLSHG